MDGTQRRGIIIVEERLHDGLNAPEGGVPFQGQGQHELVQPIPCDRQIKQNGGVGWRRIEAGLERLGGRPGLAVEKGAADLVMPGQFADGLRAGQDLDRQGLTRCRGQAGGHREKRLD
jgi:hypothetical protein